ncbi:MAG: alpha/beta hydrolase [Ilumatobacteraceae bacterium]
MSVVFVHGNPETAAIWDPLIVKLGRSDAITVSPPGFGAPVPEGFTATADEYATWLTGELEQIDGPIDLVGHDWGGGHVQRVAATRPDLIRSWCSDIAGCADPDYVWHDLAQVWQTPGDGEALVEAMSSMPVDDRMANFEGLGMTPEAARSCAEAAGPEMGRCILALYRSAAQPAMTEWGRELERAERRPGLVIIATADQYTGGEEMARRSAERFGADVAVLEGLGHWWMLEAPARGAAVIGDFLATLEA